MKLLSEKNKIEGLRPYDHFIKFKLYKHNIEISTNKYVFTKIKERNSQYIEVDLLNKLINIKDNFFKNVPNVYRYKVLDNGNKPEVYCFDDIDAQTIKTSKFYDRFTSYENQIKSIVIILESPHAVEYDIELNPIGPAQGDTGNNIENEIEELILQTKKLIQDFKNQNVYRILILNPPCVKIVVIEL